MPSKAKLAKIAKQGMKDRLKRAGWKWNSRFRRWEYHVGKALIASAVSLRAALRLDKTVRDSMKANAVGWEALMTRTANVLKAGGFETPWQAYLVGKETLIATVGGFGKKSWDELAELFEA